MFAGRKDGSKDFILRRVGILKLIDQCCGIPVANSPSQNLAALLPKRIPQADDEIIIRDRICFRLSLWSARP